MAILSVLLLAIWIGLGGRISPTSPQQDQVVIGSAFVLPAGSQMAGDVVVIQGEVRIEADAHLDGDLVVLGGPAIIDGVVEGDVIALSPQVRLGASARVRGDLVTLPGALERAPGAVVEGRQVTITTPRIVSGLRGFLPGAAPEGLLAWADRAFRMLLGGLGLILLALVVTFFFPGPVARSARTLELAPAISLGIGALILLLSVVVILILAITIIGIPLALLFLGLLSGAVLFGLISMGHLVSLRLGPSLSPGWPSGVALIIGMAMIWSLWSLADLLPLCGGPVIRLLLVAMALGSTFLSRFGTRPYPPPSARPAGSGPEGTPPVHEPSREAPSTST